MSQEIEQTEQIVLTPQEVLKIARPSFEEALMNLMSNPKYIHLSFYSFIIGKCRVQFKPEIPTAGVNFTGTSYNLFIGSEFPNWTLKERIAVLVHECRHIIGGHVFRKGERDHNLFNIAADIAMNQLIPDLPKGGMYPETFDLPKNKTAEQYYELLKEEQKKQEEEKQKCKDDNPDQNEEKEGSPSNEQPEQGGNFVFDENGEPWKPEDGKPDLTTSGKGEGFDDHSQWEQSDEDSEELAKVITEKMVKEAVSNSRGHLPQDIEDILALWKRKAKISWKKELRQILSSKRGYRVSTIKRRDRRFPGRNDLRGKKSTKDKHEIVVCVDTSGSMSDYEILDGLVEILEVSKINGSELKVIQIDTNIKGIDTFSHKNRTFTRRGCGGTYMAAGVKYMMKENINADVVIYISDMEIEDVENDNIWNTFNSKRKTKVLWLSTRGIIPDWSRSVKNHKVIDFNSK